MLYPIKIPSGLFRQTKICDTITSDRIKCDSERGRVKRRYLHQLTPLMSTPKNYMEEKRNRQCSFCR